MQHCQQMFRYVFAMLAFALLITTEEAQTNEIQQLTKARLAVERGEPETALKLVNEVLEKNKQSFDGYMLRGIIHEIKDAFDVAVANYNAAIALNPQNPEGYFRRGAVNFKLGKIDESINDFDRQISLDPSAKVSHWQRGISYYYAKRYKAGKEQFERYQTFDDNDVENAVWRYICMVPLDGKDKAREQILKIGEDKRVPMRQIYDLFAGKLQPADVLAAAKAGNLTADQLNQQLFYAHLYLGLFYESEGDAKRALEHLNIATDKHRISHYMWHVARVHRDSLKKEQLRR